MAQSLLEALDLLKKVSKERRAWTADLNSRLDAVNRDLNLSSVPQTCGKNAATIEQEEVEALVVRQRSVSYGIRALQDCKLLIVDAAASNPLQRLENVVQGAQGGDSVILRPGVYTTPVGIKRSNIVIKGGGAGQQVVLRTSEPVTFLTVQAKNVTVKAITVEQLGRTGSAMVCIPAAEADEADVQRKSSSPQLLKSSASFRAGSSGRWQPQAGTVVFEDCSFHSSASAAVLVSGGSYRFERCTFSSGGSFGLRVRQTTLSSASANSASKPNIDLHLLNCRFLNCHDGGLFISGNSQVSVRASRCIFDATPGCGVQIGAQSTVQIELDGCTFNDFGIAGVSGEAGNDASLFVSKCGFWQSGTAVDPAACIVNVMNVAAPDSSE
jgi:hypothetical protein